MVLPNFLGLGAQRCGTTWLHQQLNNHPKVYVPQKRKEIHFFDKYYHKGFNWYESFFPPDPVAGQYSCIGEITPMYIYDPEVPKRIKKDLPDCKFIAILRNPADRAYSQYAYRVQNRLEKRTFSQLLTDDPELYQRGLYGEQLKRYLDIFPPERFLVLIFEETIKAPEKGLKKIADFLGIDPQEFALNKTQEKVNSSRVVRFAKPYVFARKCAVWLKERDLDWVFNTAKAIGIRKELFGTEGTLAKIDPNIRQELLNKYQEDIAELEKIIDRKILVWS
jgi:hypothetical protein